MFLVIMILFTATVPPTCRTHFQDPDESLLNATVPIAYRILVLFPSEIWFLLIATVPTIYRTPCSSSVRDLADDQSGARAAAPARDDAAEGT